MQIIPVIDVLGGQVVAAIAGNRESYLPINSKITSQTDPIAVVEALLELSAFKTIYIADLDAIQSNACDVEAYHQLFNHFPSTNFWFDYGVNSKEDLEPFRNCANVHIVLGSETLTDLTLLADEQCLLSLDYRAGQALGLAAIHNNSEAWPNRVIVMSLDQVGVGKGPNYSLLEQIQEKGGERQFFAAGGVRDQADLEYLEKIGIKGVLIASALHNGKLDKQCLQRYL